MRTNKIEAPVLQQKLGQLLGMDKTASGKTSVDRLAFLTQQAKDNMEILKTAMAVPAPQKPAPKKEEPKKEDAEKKAALRAELKGEILKISSTLSPVQETNEEKELMKAARGELVLAIMTEGLTEPYGQIAKAAGIVTLNSICRSQNQ